MSTLRAAVSKKHDVIVIGAGTGGTAVAARLARARPDLDIAIVDPSLFHYYQPAWTLVGGRQYAIGRTRRPTSQVVPAGVTYLEDCVTAFLPETNAVILGCGQQLHYDFLVIGDCTSSRILLWRVSLAYAPAGSQGPSAFLLVAEETLLSCVLLAYLDQG